MNMRENDTLRAQLEDANRQREMTDLKVSDQNQSLMNENNSLRLQLRELNDRNVDLENRLNKSLIDRSVAYERSGTGQAESGN